MMRKYDTYWESNKDWYYVKDGRFIVREDAPKEAQDSYKHYLEQLKEMREYAKRKRIIA